MKPFTDLRHRMQDRRALNLGTRYPGRNVYDKMPT